MRYVTLNTFVFAAWISALSCAATADKKLALPAPDWDAVFQRTSGWTGGDAIGRFQAQRDAELHETSWGSEVVLDDSSESEPPEALTFGVREGKGWNKQMVLARVAADRIEQFAHWQFRTETGWSSRFGDVAPVANSMVNEFSVHRLTIGAKPRWVLVQSEPLFGTHILIRTAPNAWGPWSSPKRVYRVPGVDKSRNYFTYAAKGHAELSAQGKLLVSYIINSHDFGEAVGDANIYRPRFINVSLDALDFDR